MNKTTTKHAVRHLNHKNSRFLQHLVIDDKLKLSTNTNTETSTSDVQNVLSPLDDTTNNCFSTNQVLVVIAVTCFLNFAFIILIMLCVQVLGSTTSEKENLEEESLINDDIDDVLAESGGLTSWETSKLRLASLPDNVITKNIAERLLKSGKLKSKLGYMAAYRQFSKIPLSKTYNFIPHPSLDSDDFESECDSLNHRNKFFNYNNYKPNYTRHYQSSEELLNELTS